MRNKNALMLLGMMFFVSLIFTWAIFEREQEIQTCSDGFQQEKTRCCAPGQMLFEGSCTGIPHSCPPGFILASPPTHGCYAKNEQIILSGGDVLLGPTDWDSAEVVERKVITVAPFAIDSHEVTAIRYHRCVQSQRCPFLGPFKEAGLPVTNISMPIAQAFCSWAGGRLPSSEEWTFAAAGKNARRYPWGSHGLVCRRAVYGLTSGPCGRGRKRADWTGSRPDGATSEGIHDLAGNVAEMTLDDSGQLDLRGGSFRTQAASSLKSWSTVVIQERDEIGFRCVYESPL